MSGHSTGEETPRETCISLGWGVRDEAVEPECIGQSTGEKRVTERERPPKEPLKLQLQIDPYTLSEEEMRRELPKRETCSNHQRPHKDESSSRSSWPGWQTSRYLEYWVFGHSGSYLSGRFTRASHQGLLVPTSLKVSLKRTRLLTSSLTASENNSTNTQHLAKADLWCLASDK